MIRLIRVVNCHRNNFVMIFVMMTIKQIIIFNNFLTIIKFCFSSNNNEIFIRIFLYYIHILLLIRITFLWKQENCIKIFFLRFIQLYVLHALYIYINLRLFLIIVCKVNSTLRFLFKSFRHT